MRPGAWRYENSIANNLHQRLFSIQREGDAIICKKKVSTEIPHRKIPFFNAQGGSMDDWVTCLEVESTEFCCQCRDCPFEVHESSLNRLVDLRWPCKDDATPDLPQSSRRFELNGSEIILQERQIRVEDFFDCENNKNIFIYSIFFSYMYIVVA